jgi:tRNA nucleotidyltransferase (CCA-adding enzyme)
VVEFMERSDAFRRPERFARALLACEADSRGRAGWERNAYPQREYLLSAREAAASVKPAPEDLAGLSGAAIAQLISRRRLDAVTAVRARY